MSYLNEALTRPTRNKYNIGMSKTLLTASEVISSVDNLETQKGVLIYCGCKRLILHLD